MVRIIQENNIPQKPKSEPKPEQLNYKHTILLNVLGLIVADKPQQVRQLLEDYSIELSRESTEEELADLLIYAICECDADFNMDLASLILDNTLSDSYDQYDFKELAGQASSILSNAKSNQDAKGEAAPGVLNGLTSTIGQIGGIVGQGIQALQARSKAAEQTRLGIFAHRKQQLEAQEAGQKRKNNLIIISLLVLLGFGLMALIAQFRKQAQTNFKTP